MNSVTCVDILPINLCFWNLNGVKNKFMMNQIKNLFETKDIVVIVETHFNIRCKCPEDFLLVARSLALESKKVEAVSLFIKKLIVR